MEELEVLKEIKVPNLIIIAATLLKLITLLINLKKKKKKDRKVSNERVRL